MGIKSINEQLFSPLWFPCDGYWLYKENRYEYLDVVLSPFSHVQLFVTPWSVARQAPLSMGFSRQEYWNGLPFPSSGDLPDPGIEPASPASQADSLPTELWGKPYGAVSKHKIDTSRSWPIRIDRAWLLTNQNRGHCKQPGCPTLTTRKRLFFSRARTWARVFALVYTPLYWLSTRLSSSEIWLPVSSPPSVPPKPSAAICIQVWI